MQIDRKILACVDTTPLADVVTDYATWAACRLDAPLELLHVLERHVEPPGKQDHSGAIGLDAQAGGQTAEIHDVSRDRHLAAKVKGVQLAAAQQRPELLLRVGGRAAHVSREGDQSSAMVAFAGHGDYVAAELCNLSNSAPSPRSTGGGGRRSPELPRSTEGVGGRRNYPGVLRGRRSPELPRSTGGR